MDKNCVKCIDCGKELHGAPKNTKYCPECRKLKVKEKNARRYAMKVGKSVPEIRRRKKCRDKLSEDALKATELGMSYGKYMAKYRNGHFFRLR